MDVPTLIASVGVGLLLLAFFLAVMGWMHTRDKAYALLNVIGAGMSCYASWLIDFMPFVILEGVWCLVALFALAGFAARLSPES